MTDEKLKEIAKDVMCDDYLREAMKQIDPVTYELTKELAENEKH